MGNNLDKKSQADAGQHLQDFYRLETELKTISHAGKLRHLKVKKGHLELAKPLFFTRWRKQAVRQHIITTNNELTTKIKALNSDKSLNKYPPLERMLILREVSRIQTLLSNVDDVQQDDNLCDSYLDALETCVKIEKLIGSQQSEEYSQIPTLTKLSKLRIIDPTRKRGGAKGLGFGYGPALRELETAEKLKDVKKVVGSSAGALTGTYLAGGVTPIEINTRLEKLTPNKLKKNCTDHKTKYPGLMQRSRKGHGATNFVEELDTQTATHIQVYLKKNWEDKEFQSQLQDLKLNDKTFTVRAEQLMEQDFNKNRTDQMVTFRDLAFLHALAPEQFKELTITAWDDTNQKEFHFDANNTPNFQIAYAARLSMSNPHYFSAVTLDPGDGTPRKFIDGRIGSNIPTLTMLSKPRIIVIRRAPTIENLVLKGGGAKGLGYGPALNELEKAGKLKDLKKIVGSSAGAITCAYLAGGVTPKEIKTRLEELNPDKLMKNCTDHKTKYPGLTQRSRRGHGATNFVEELDTQTAIRVQKYLKKNWKNNKFQIKLRDKNFTGRAEQLMKQEFKTDRTNHMVTFSDLEFLHTLAPEQFKELTITAWDPTNQKEFYFDAKNTPNFQIAYAARLSMSIPHYFSAVTLDPGDGKPRKFIDGGIGSNVPTEAVLAAGKTLTEKEMEKIRSRTLVMTFMDKGHAHKVMHEPRVETVIEAIMIFIMGVLSGNWNYRKTNEEDEKKVREAGPNAFVIAHGKLGLLGLNATDTNVKRARRFAKIKAREQIALYHSNGNATLETYENVEEIFDTLDANEKEAIYNPLRKVDTVRNELDQNLYNLVCDEKKPVPKNQAAAGQQPPGVFEGIV